VCVCVCVCERERERERERKGMKRVCVGLCDVIPMFLHFLSLFRSPLCHKLFLFLTFFMLSLSVCQIPLCFSVLFCLGNPLFLPVSPPLSFSPSHPLPLPLHLSLSLSISLSPSLFLSF